MTRKSLWLISVLCGSMVLGFVACSPPVTKYSVTYMANGATGGSVPVDSNTYAPDQKVTVLGNTGNLVKSHDTFYDWNSTAAGTQYKYSAGDTFIMGTSNVTLYAQWSLTPPSFAAQQTFPVGTSPSSVTTADINGDGLPDIIVANEADNTVSVLLNTTPTGASTVSFQTQQTINLTTSPYFVTTADLNGDGKPDIIVANGATDTISVLLNTTPNKSNVVSFGSPQSFTVGNSPYSVTTADLNGDGLPDIIVANEADDTVSVLLNTTTTAGASIATFAPQQIFDVGNNPSSVTTADIDQSGLPDIIVANDNAANVANGNTVSVLLNNTVKGASTVSFQTQQTFLVGPGASSVLSADINQDGLPDLVVVSAPNDIISLLLNTTAKGSATANFAPLVSFPVGVSPLSATSTDVNGDGSPDIITANNSDGTVSVVLNTTAKGASTLSFANRSTFDVGSVPDGVASADINGDGKPDVITANSGNNSVSVLLNTTVE